MHRYQVWCVLINMDNIELKNKDLEKIDSLLRQLETIEPREGLFFDCLDAIKKRIILKLKIKLAALGIVFSVFVFTIIYNWQSIARQVMESETLNLLSLFISDSEIIFKNWQYYSLYLIESLPIIPIALILSGILLVLLIFKILIQELSYKTYTLAHR